MKDVEYNPVEQLIYDGWSVTIGVNQYHILTLTADRRGESITFNGPTLEYISKKITESQILAR